MGTTNDERSSLVNPTLSEMSGDDLLRLLMENIKATSLFVDLTRSGPFPNNLLGERIDFTSPRADATSRELWTLWGEVKLLRPTDKTEVHAIWLWTMAILDRMSRIDPGRFSQMRIGNEGLDNLWKDVVGINLIRLRSKAIRVFARWHLRKTK